MAEFDVVVIGAGGAGCAAALTIAQADLRVALIMRDTFKGSKTARAQGGIQAAIGPGDSWESHLEDTIKAGENAGDRALAEVLTKGAPSAIDWLIEQGVVFDLTQDGDFRLQTAGGLSHPRILSCGDQSGNRIIGPLKERVENSAIILIEHAAVLSVENQSGIFELSVMDPRDKSLRSLSAKSLVIASGGASSRSAPTDIPDTIALASASGLEIKAAALTQFHPTGVLSPIAMRGRPAPEGLRAAGANILDKDMNPIADPLWTRKKLCEAITLACETGQGVRMDDGKTGVWLNTPKIDEINGIGYAQRHYTSFYDAALAQGVDIAKELILVHPIPHYSLGGIVIDTDTATNIPGVFAAGEATWGVHGNDRLMGNSLLEIFVFGRIAGSSAARYVHNNQ
jgi:aspartate oxidase